MPNKMWVRAEEEKGFTLIELLVVILIIGVLAAMAIPSFLNQRSKANDASAKELARTAQTTMETYGNDHNGSWAGVAAPSDLSAIEKTINTSSTNGQAYLNTATGSGSGYTVVTTAAVTGDRYTIVNNNGTISHSCSAGTGSGQPGGCLGGTW